MSMKDAKHQDLKFAGTFQGEGSSKCKEIPKMNSPKRNISHMPVVALCEQVKTYYVDSWTAGPNKSVLYGKGESVPVFGGTPITYEVALKLRQTTYGSARHTFTKEWRRSRFVFFDQQGPFSYGLQTQRCGAKGLIICVQAYVLKHLLFNMERTRNPQNINLLRVSEHDRKTALLIALSEMLWRAGDERQCFVCLLQDKSYFFSDFLYRDDGFTERIHIFEFRKLEDVKDFLKQYLYQFENQYGCILFLYSLTLSRTFPRLYDDMGLDQTKDKVQLLNDMEKCNHSLINLLLTGHAIRYLHNGDILYDSLGVSLSKPMKGIKMRNFIGFLYWNKEEEDGKRTMVESRMKTPKYPLWVTHVNGQFGLLFSTKLELISDWRSEHNFTLHYYTGLLSQGRLAILSLETRLGRQIKSVADFRRKREERQIPPLEQCILTKWPDASVNWNEMIPFL